MKRREFIALAAGAAASPLALPMAARAQQPLPVIGFLDGAAETPAILTAFAEGLKIEGFVQDHSVRIEFRSAQGNDSRLSALATDLVNGKVAAIAAVGVAAARAAKAATASIPIIFAVASDPVQIGLVESLNRPGGNVTGVTSMGAASGQKRLALLHELLPAASSFALLVNPTNPLAEAETQDARAAAGTMGLQVTIFQASTESDFDPVFAKLSQSRAAGLAISDDGLFVDHSEQLAALTVRHAIPAVFEYRAFAAAGGLMSYGSNVLEFYHQLGAYSGLVLRGARPADLPVFQSTRVEFIVNLTTAKALDIAFPPALLGSADEVIR
jgi:putative ABC transport system substrate-binding protein